MSARSTLRLSVPAVSGRSSAPPSARSLRGRLLPRSAWLCRGWTILATMVLGVLDSAETSAADLIRQLFRPVSCANTCANTGTEGERRPDDTRRGWATWAGRGCGSSMQV